jgi:hypothetical protein
MFPFGFQYEEKSVEEQLATWAQTHVFMRRVLAFLHTKKEFVREELAGLGRSSLSPAPPVPLTSLLIPCLFLRSLLLASSHFSIFSSLLVFDPPQEFSVQAMHLDGFYEAYYLLYKKILRAGAYLLMVLVFQFPKILETGLKFLKKDSEKFFRKAQDRS